MRRYLRHIVIVFIAGLALSPAWAQRSVQVSVKKYTQADGLSSYNVRNIAQDRNGFIWVGTQFGLNRFDGRRFTTYSRNAPAGQRLSGIDIRQLAEDTQRHMMWVLPGDQGLDGIGLQTGKVVAGDALRYPNREEFGMSMLLLHDRLWLGSSTGVRIFNTRTSEFEAQPAVPRDTNKTYDLEAQSLFADTYGNVWCFYNGYGLVIYDGRTAKTIRQFPIAAISQRAGTVFLQFNDCMAVDATTLLLATSQGLKKISYNKSYDLLIDQAPCASLTDINTGAIEAICRSRSGELFVADHSHLYRFNASLTSYVVLREQVNNAEGDWLGSVHCIYVDQHDNVWLGCQQGLACVRAKDSPFTSVFFDRNTDRKLDHVRSMYVLNSGEILAGLRNGIARVDRVTGSFTISDEDHLYHHIWEDPLGKIHGAREDGMFLLMNGQQVPIQQHYPEFKQFAGNPINSHLFIGDSLVVLGTENDNGVFVWNYNRHTVTQLSNATQPHLASNVVNNVFKDKQGRVWILSDQVITIVSADLKTARPLMLRDETLKREINLFFDVCEAGGYYWLAAYGTGLVQLDEQLRIKHIFSTSDGLSDNSVYQVFPIDGRIIVTSDNGLSLFDINTKTFRAYYKEDGLHSNSFEEVAGVAKDGLVYAGGVKGFTIIDPSKFSSNTIAPQVYISRLAIDLEGNSPDIDTTNLQLNELEIPNSVLQSTIYFSGINFGNPEHTTFAYRILENDDDWVNIGTQNYMSLIGLAPGTYHLEVRAANEDNVWSEPVALTLVYLPKWYQTWWFKVALVLLAVGIAYGIYRVRINQILRQQQIRKDVASDLHDDIGSSLNSVKLFAHLAMKDPAQPEYIMRVEENIEQATLGLRDMIWVLDDDRDSVDDLRERLSQFAVKAAEAIGIHVHFKVDDTLKERDLSKTIKRNLFLIVKEAINNCVKYADCRNIYINFELKGKKLELTIKDDGKGFDRSQVSEGYGLLNMKTRADQIHFACSITSGTGGTTIVMTEL